MCWPTFAQNLWKPVKNASNVTVFTKQLPGKSYQSFMAVGYLHSTPAKVAAILDDVTHYEQWFAYLDSVEILEVTADEKYVYLELDFPWPFANEDMIFKVSLSESESGEKKYLLQGVPSFAPDRDGIRRMRDATGCFLLEQEGAGTKLTFVMHMDLSGDIPPWLANKNIHFLPLKTLKNLAKISGKR